MSEAVETKPVEEVAFIAHRFFGGSISYPLKERVDWIKIEKEISRSYDSRSGVVTISCREAPPSCPRRA